MAKLLTTRLGVLAHPARLALLGWLREPRRHFPAQRDGDLVRDGVCAVNIARRWGVTQPTASRHLGLMVRAGLLVATRRRGWIFYRRNERAIAALRAALGRAT